MRNIAKHKFSIQQATIGEAVGFLERNEDGDRVIIADGQVCSLEELLDALEGSEVSIKGTKIELDEEE